MNLLASLPAFPAYAATVIVLGLNLVGLANATALTRGQAKEVVNPEDQALNKTAKVTLDNDNDRTARYRRAHRNALENTPWFMITAFVLTMMGTSGTVAAALFYSYARSACSTASATSKGSSPSGRLASPSPSDPGRRARAHRLPDVRRLTPVTPGADGRSPFLTAQKTAPRMKSRSEC